MRKFFLKFLIFCLPFLIYTGYSAYEILVLPIDFYTFRAWEAITVYSQNQILSGPFYPNSHIRMFEEGDLAHREGFSVKKSVEWFTDDYGFRKKNTDKKKHEVVIIGDSYIAGTTLTQKDTLSEQLEERLGVSVYPYAPRTINDFLQERRFLDNSPDIVIFEVVEKLSLHVPYPKTNLELKTNFFEKIRMNGPTQNLAILLDRLRKRQLFNFLYSRLQTIPEKIILKFFGSPNALSASAPNLGGEPKEEENFGLNVGKDGKMVFAGQADEYFIDFSERDIREDGYLKFLEYQKVLSQRGTKFILLLIPNKENIYWENVKGGRATANLRRLIEGSKKAGVVTIDTQALYESQKINNPEKLLYHLDDTHWTPYGVNLVAEEVAKVIKEKDF